MNRKDAINTFRWRQSIVDCNYKLINSVKKHKENKLKNAGQLNLFSVGLEDDNRKNIDIYDGEIDIKAFARLEMELLGFPITYHPINDYDEIKDVYCTHNPIDLLQMTEDESGIIILDWILDLTRHKSKKSGNSYYKIYTSLLGGSNYMHLWGNDYKRLAHSVFVNEIYLFEVKFIAPTPEFSRESIAITHLKNVKDISYEDFNVKLNDLKASFDYKESNEPWQIKNRNK